MTIAALTTMTQYAYMTPAGDLRAVSFDSTPPLTVSMLDDEPVELVIAGPRQYLPLLEGSVEELERLVAGLIAIMPAWIVDRRGMLRSLGAALINISVEAVDRAREDVRATLSTIDTAVRNAAVGSSAERASMAWVAALVAVLIRF